MLEIREHPPSMQKTSTMNPLGGDAGDSGAPTISAKNVNGDLLGGSAVRDPGAPTINTKNIHDGPHCEAMPEIWECPPST
jgi:hypothetical protein